MCDLVGHWNWFIDILLVARMKHLSSHPLFRNSFIGISLNHAWRLHLVARNERMCTNTQLRKVSKLTMWMFAGTTSQKGQNREFCKQKSNEIASVKFRRRKKKVVKFHSWSLSFIWLFACFDFFFFPAAPSSFDSNSIPKLESTQTFLLLSDVKNKRKKTKIVLDGKLN